MKRGLLLILALLAGLGAPANAAWRHVVDYTYANSLVAVDGIVATASTRGGALFDPDSGEWRHMSLFQGLLSVDLADVCSDGAGTLFWAGKDASLSARSLRGDVESRGFLEFREHPQISSIHDLWGGDGGVLVSHSIGVTRFEYLPERDEFLVRWNLSDLGAFSSQSPVLAAAPLGSLLAAVTAQGLAVGTGYPAEPVAFQTLSNPGGLALVEKAWLAPGSQRLFALLRDSQNLGWLGALDSTGSWTTLRTDLHLPLALAVSDTLWAAAVIQDYGSRVYLGDGRNVFVPQVVGALAFSGDTLWATLLPDTRRGGLAAIVDGQYVGSWQPDVPGAEQFTDLDFAPNGELWAVGVSPDLWRNGLFQLTDTGWRPWQLGYNYFANYPTSVCCDRHGGVWFGSWGKGVSRLVPADSSLVSFNGDPTSFKRMAGFANHLGGSDPNFCLVSDVEEDVAGNLWMVNHQASDDSCLVVLPAAWYADSSTALVRHRYSQYQQYFPYFVEPAASGLVWLGLAGENSTDVSKRVLQLSPRGLPVSRMAEWRLEEHQLADASWNFDQEAPGTIRGLATDPDGNLWASTSDGFYMGGLYGNTAQFSRVQFIDGLLSEDLGAVEVDGRGRIWLGSSKGLNIYEPEAGAFREPAVVDELNAILRQVDLLKVNKLKMNPRTGEVWVATNLGLFVNAEGAQNYGTTPAGSVRMYPNPFRPDGAKRARVLPEGLANDAQLTIYDANGRHLRSLSLLEAEAGWDGRDAHGEFVPSGVYLLLITSSGGSAEGKIAVIR